MYVPNQFLKDAVAGGNAFTVRGAIVGIIQANPRNESNEVNSAVQYAEAHGVKVFEEKNDPALEMIADESKWDSEYFAVSVTYLQANFTRARLAHVLAVSRKTHPALSAPSISSAPRQPQSAYHGHSGGQRDEAPKKDRSRMLPVLMAGAGVALAALVIYLLIDRG